MTDDDDDDGDAGVPLGVFAQLQFRRSASDEAGARVSSLPLCLAPSSSSAATVALVDAALEHSLARSVPPSERSVASVVDAVSCMVGHRDSAPCCELSSGAPVAGRVAAFFRFFGSVEQRRIALALALLPTKCLASQWIVAMAAASTAPPAKVALNAAQCHKTYAELILAASEHLPPFADTAMDETPLSTVHAFVSRFLEDRKQRVFEAVFTKPTIYTLSRALGVDIDIVREAVEVHGSNTYLALLEAGLGVVLGRRAYLNDSVAGVFPFLDHRFHVSPSEYRALRDHILTEDALYFDFEAPPQDRASHSPAHLRAAALAHLPGHHTPIDANGHPLQLPCPAPHGAFTDPHTHAHSSGSLARTLLNARKARPYLRAYARHFAADRVLPALWRALDAAGLVERALQPIWECMELVKVPPTLGRLTVLEGYAASEGGWEDSATLSARSRTSSFAVVEEDDGEEQGEVQSVAETMAEDEGGVREWVAPFGVLVLERVRALMDFAGVTDAEAGDGFTEGIDDGDEDGNDDFGEDENSKAEEDEETVQVVMGRLVDTLRSIGAYDFVAAGMEEKLENDDVDAKWAWHDEGSDNNEEGLEAFKLVI